MLADELDILAGFQVGLELAGFDGGFEGALDVADEAGGREREGDHELVADAGGQGRLDGVFGGELADFFAELVDEGDAAALLFGALVLVLPR